MIALVTRMRTYGRCTAPDPEARDWAEWTAGRSVLRGTWYDAAPYGRPTDEQQALARVPGVHVRLGTTQRRPDGRVQQKAVDTAIVRDLVIAALNRIADDVVVISGDADLTPGIQEAANHGLRIHLWAVPLDANGDLGQAADLGALADLRLTIDLEDLSPHVLLRPMRDIYERGRVGEAARAETEQHEAVRTPALDARATEVAEREEAVSALAAPTPLVLAKPAHPLNSRTSSTRPPPEQRSDAPPVVVVSRADPALSSGRGTR